MEKRTFYELLEAYRKTAIEQSKQTGTSMNDCGAALCGIDILDNLADMIRDSVHGDFEEGYRVGYSDAKCGLSVPSFLKAEHARKDNEQELRNTEEDVRAWREEPNEER